MAGIRESLIVALDTDAHTALSLARTLTGHVGWVKVGMTLYCAEGPDIVRRMREMGFDVFVDLKLHDIPHQVRGAAREIARTGAAMLTVHAGGGEAMMREAVAGACEASEECGLDTPDVVAVTVLTSMDAAALTEVGIERPASAQAELLARAARDAGVQGVVCSPHEARAMREVFGEEGLVVTPGVRPAGAERSDQARVATPREALDAGASYLVIGRPVTAAEDPIAAIERIVSEE